MAQEAAEEEEVEEFWEGRDVTSPEGAKEADPKEEAKKEVAKEDKKDVVTPQSVNSASARSPNMFIYYLISFTMLYLEFWCQGATRPSVAVLFSFCLK